MKILIGTPCGSGTVSLKYLLALRELEACFRRQEPTIASNILFGVSSFLPFSRNGLASVVLEDRSYSHMLFIDADMAFKPEAVLKLIHARKDIIGCLYSKRAIQIGRLHAVAREVDDVDRARNIALDYAAAEELRKRIVQTPSGRKTVHMVENGLIRTLRLGMGLTLIRREVLERMAETMPELMIDSSVAVQYQGMGLKGRVLQCFSSVVVNGLSMSEDLSFCHRWVNTCGGEIWACVDQTISHIGEMTYQGRMLDRIEYEDREVLEEMRG